MNLPVIFDLVNVSLHTETQQPIVVGALIPPFLVL